MDFCDSHFKFDFTFLPVMPRGGCRLAPFPFGTAKLTLYFHLFLCASTFFRAGLHCCDNIRPAPVLYSKRPFNLHIMKHTLIPLLLAAAVLPAAFSSCKSQKPAAQAAPSAAIEGKWYFATVRATEVHNSDAAEEWPYLMFDPAAGRVSGNAGCNQLSGSYACTAQGDITFGDDMISTRMLCPDMSLEREVMQSLPMVRHYTLTDGTLTLTAGDGACIATMSRTAPVDGGE